VLEMVWGVFRQIDGAGGKRGGRACLYPRDGRCLARRGVRCLAAVGGERGQKQGDKEWSFRCARTYKIPRRLWWREGMSKGGRTDWGEGVDSVQARCSLK
jgi:hypothetical protein